MADRIPQIVAALTELGKAVEEAGSQHGDKTLREIWGWNCPPLSGKQLGSMAKLLADKIGKIKEENLNPKFGPSILMGRIEDFKANTLPYLWNGNAAGAAPQYFGLLQWVELVFEPVYEVEVDWEKMAADGLMPKQITNKLRTFNTRIKRFDIDFGQLSEKIEYINQAHDAAEALPTDLETLRAANDEIADAKAGVEKNKILSEAAHEEVDRLLKLITGSEAEARQLVQNTEDAYSAATTRGLGEAFQQRANRLALSMWTWVGGLVLALGMGAVIGHFRVFALQELLAKNASSGAVTLSSLLAIISVAAPVWFAWIATKQIGHRFRLSEDYAFKASVAQAYEGYRREAARVDPNFARRLFGSALDRLEEPPIRFVEHETFGSPWHEILRMRQRNRGQTASSVDMPRVDSAKMGIAGTETT
ncbi:hypothetical protein B5K05_03975 [Rhizobium phaseoli]|uniref:hypothetical protein n=1 Tax=Rhizobium phaseoli TaxID=396 RepID=UPI000E0DB17B|nr:hypothetical protein [Rhizobium phaseoli]RDJ17240.1 hypothetical protein B5K04_03955 [Rhizobium phaseoli]RDJ18833.1 hypothetical protein B5K05_03975 [Rhizobium phaseoli]